jgi:hypothetical protein
VERNGQKLKFLKIAQPYFQGKIPSCAFEWPKIHDTVQIEESMGFGTKYDINASFFWMQFEDWCHEFTKGMRLSIQIIPPEDGHF